MDRGAWWATDHGVTKGLTQLSDLAQAVYHYLLMHNKPPQTQCLKTISMCCGNGNPLQYSCLESPMDRGAWWAVVHGVTKSRTQLSE